MVGVAVTGATYLGGQSLAAASIPGRLETEIRHKNAYNSLQKQVNGEILLDFLRNRTSDGSAIIEVNGQFLGVMLDRTVIGLPPARYSRRIWDERAILELVREYNVTLICLFAPFLDDLPREHRNIVFMADLAKGPLPDWLRLIFECETARIYEVERTKLEGSLKQQLYNRLDQKIEQSK
jgi:hypothetical protein